MLALAPGVDLKTVSTALGHSTIAMTANIYMHAVEVLDRDAANRLDAMLGKTVGDALWNNGIPSLPEKLWCWRESV